MKKQTKSITKNIPLLNHFIEIFLGVVLIAINLLIIFSYMSLGLLVVYSPLLSVSTNGMANTLVMIFALQVVSIISAVWIFKRKKAGYYLIAINSIIMLIIVLIRSFTSYSIDNVFIQLPDFLARNYTNIIVWGCMALFYFLAGRFNQNYLLKVDKKERNYILITSGFFALIISLCLFLV